MISAENPYFSFLTHFSSFAIYSELFCATCASFSSEGSHIIFSYKGANCRIVFLKCCVRPMHVNKCFEEFFSKSYDVGGSRCPVCKTRWFDGSPKLDKKSRYVSLSNSLRYVEDHVKHIQKYNSERLVGSVFRR